MGLPKRLTEKQIKFANLVVSEEGRKTNTECAVEAGYDENSAYVSASKLQNPLLYPLVTQYIGRLRAEKIKKYDILLHLSKREGLPVAVMQSLSEGLPVICYNIRGNKDLIKDKFNGYFIQSYRDVPKKIHYLNLEDGYFNKMRVNAFRSINKDFLKKKENTKKKSSQRE